MGNDHSRASKPSERPLKFFLLLSLFGVAFIACIALGIWQVQRLSWKTALIERVEKRLESAPLPPPPPASWQKISREAYEYTPTRVHGRFIPEMNTYVKAVTELGSGSWLMTPMQLDTGEVVFINRGFVPRNFTGDLDPPSDSVELTGLLRISEPGGAFLRENDPENGRWFSRDIQALAAVNKLNKVAPFFIDQQTPANGTASPWPRAGLTIVNFRNTHLSYALTWFALAALSAWAIYQLIKETMTNKGASRNTLFSR